MAAYTYLVFTFDEPVYTASGDITIHRSDDGTNVEAILKTLGTETILVGGISTQRSVEGTARDAKNRDIQCVVVSDCCTAGEIDVHNMTIEHVLPLLVQVRNTDEIIAGLHS